ncbi:hypothetical protein CPAV1605_600 [seawater metagenome]|uniref:Uncharacterized protein n=1 Tax=seawater metagenome TaxID=1561972 RepID=A0A5E8CLH3_9ZZZZ
MIHPQCSICVRNVNNYEGSFMLIAYKNKKKNQDNPDFIKSVLEMKWACELHYPLMYKYKKYTWPEAKKLISQTYNIQDFTL